MVFYHFMWDLHFFGIYPVDVTVGGWRLFSRCIAALFLLLVGVSMVLAAERRSPKARDRLWLTRGAKLLGWALSITVVTRLFLGDTFILFGILHLIGVALLLAPLLWRGRAGALVIGPLLIGAGVLLSGRVARSMWWLPFGMRPAGFESVDYYPLLPWLGVIVIGLGLGQLIAPILLRTSVRERVTEKTTARERAPGLFAPLAAVGRHALAVYIIHQPLMLAVFWLFGYSI